MTALELFKSVIERGYDRMTPKQSAFFRGLCAREDFKVFKPSPSRYSGLDNFIAEVDNILYCADIHPTDSTYRLSVVK